MSGKSRLVRRPRSQERCVVLLSGGLDSAVALAAAKKKYRVAFALTLVYGQRSARRELEAARAICRCYSVPIRIVDISWLGRASRSILTCRTRPSQRQLRSLNAVWVPNRNGVFLSVAAALAEAARVRVVVTGFNHEEARDFPDNRTVFVNAFNRSLVYSTGGRVRVISPVAKLNKKQIVGLGLALKVPFEVIYSCYLGSDKMCGRCASCLRLKKALRQSGGHRYLRRLFG